MVVSASLILYSNLLLASKSPPNTGVASVLNSVTELIVIPFAPFCAVVVLVPPAMVNVSPSASVMFPLSVATINCCKPPTLSIITLLLSDVTVTLPPALIFLNCKSNPVFCAKTPCPAVPKLDAVVCSGLRLSSSVKLLLTFTNASRKSSPVPSFATPPILTAVSYTHLTLPTN